MNAYVDAIRMLAEAHVNELRAEAAMERLARSVVRERRWLPWRRKPVAAVTEIRPPAAQSDVDGKAA